MSVDLIDEPEGQRRRCDGRAEQLNAFVPCGARRLFDGAGHAAGDEGRRRDGTAWAFGE